MIFKRFIFGGNMFFYQLTANYEKSQMLIIIKLRKITVKYSCSVCFYSLYAYLCALII